jgi:serine/threonine protein kinase
MQSLLANKYIINEKIGNGSFGSLFKGMNIRTKESVAIKVEPVEFQLKLLKNESILYQYLKDIKGVPTIKWYGHDNINYYMVIELLGPSLEKVKQNYGCISLYTTIKNGIKILDLLESIHNKGLVHRDIKPDNFLFGLGSLKDNLYLIDFGFCKSFLINNKHIVCKKTKKIIGSANFASIHSHEHQELSRRDDLESLFYILCYLYFGVLEWSKTNIFENYEKNNEQIRILKTQMFQNKEVPTIFKTMLEYIRSLAFEEKPNYEFLRNSLNECIV